MRKFLIFNFSFLISLLLFCISACEAQQRKRPMDNEAVQFCMSMGIGWNLGNQMDAHYNGCSYEDGWGNKIATQQTFDGVAKAGFKSVRIPVTWMGHIGNAPTYTIEKGWLERVAELVDMAHKAGLVVIINIHHDGFGAADTPSKGYHWLDLPAAVADDEKNQLIKQELTMVWLQIGKRFANYGEWLVFETVFMVSEKGRFRCTI